LCLQNQLELAGSAAGQAGGQALAAAWHAALEASAGQHFPGNQLINCMCHNTNVSSAVCRCCADAIMFEQRWQLRHVLYVKRTMRVCPMSTEQQHHRQCCCMLLWHTIITFVAGPKGHNTRFLLLESVTVTVDVMIIC
jgi:hypothetical protein